MKHLSLLTLTALIIAMLCSCESTISESYSDGKDVSVAGKTYRWQDQDDDSYDESIQYSFSNDSLNYLYQCKSLDVTITERVTYNQENEVVFYTLPNDKSQVAISYGDFLITNRGFVFNQIK